MTVIQQQELTEELLEKVRIFVDSDALAFFDVPRKPFFRRATDVAKLENNYFHTVLDRWSYAQKVNFSVEKYKVHYFTIGDYASPFCTVSVTGPCIVYCAYTTGEDGGIKSSGVYHAFVTPSEEAFQKNYFKLIDTVRSRPGEIITVKVAGREYSREYCEETKNKLIKLLAVKDVKIKLENISLGGPIRIIEFYPQTGQLATRYYNEKQKTII